MPKVTITSILRAVATAVTVSIAISCNVNNLPHQLGEAESFMRHSPKQAKEILAQAGKYRTTLTIMIGTGSFSGLTPGNIRIACLVRLGFTTSESAVILGISPASVTKAKQRLKSRLS